MKYSFLICTALFFFSGCIQAQQNNPPLSDYAGGYGTKDSTLFSILQDNNRLYFHTAHYGNIEMAYVGGTRFKLKQVTPEAFMDFTQANDGAINGLTVNQKGKFTWLRIPDSISAAQSTPLSPFTGTYKQDIDVYNTVTVSERNGRLVFNYTVLSPVSANKFANTDSGRNDLYEFVKDKQGKVEKVVLNADGPKRFEKRSADIATLPALQRPADPQHLTRADTLMGMLTPLRACYDVLFYNLAVTIEPATKTIRGNNTIRFKVIAATDSLQVDLNANLKISRILFHNREIPYSREYNAVYVKFPKKLQAGNTEELNIEYAGQPQTPDYNTMSGGIFWVQNKDGKMWIQSVCQGSGASLWWPCKDHLSDESDSMRISITVPKGLTDISNGRLLAKTELPNNLTRFDWYVSYPINNYNVAINIGDYAHFTDTYTSSQDTLTLDFYCMPYNLAIAKELFANVKPMLALFENKFGNYPFHRDGFTLMESFYPMEHQSAVSLGYLNTPFNSDKYDIEELKRLMWHESAHEWWGNNISCKDFADLWIHETFATYAEVLAYETFSGKAAALKYLSQQHPANKKPVIGIYNVNNFYLGDQYTKGPLMLHTLRNVINNDPLWFTILRGMQERFRYQTVTTEDIVGYFNTIAQKDYTPFFDQYLRYATIPELVLQVKQEGTGVSVQYKWNADVKAFNMPVRLTTGKDNTVLITPTTGWQTINLPNTTTKDITVNKEDYYIKVSMQ